MLAGYSLPNVMAVKIKFAISSQTFEFLAKVQTFPVFATAGFYTCFLRC